MTVDGDRWSTTLTTRNPPPSASARRASRRLCCRHAYASQRCHSGVVSCGPERRARLEEPRRHHADDPSGDAVQHDRSTDDRGIAAETRPPQAVAQHRDAVCACRAFTRLNARPRTGATPKRLEESRRHQRPRDLRGVAGRVNAKSAPKYADMLSNDLLRRRQSSSRPPSREAGFASCSSPRAARRTWAKAGWAAGIRTPNRMSVHPTDLATAPADMVVLHDCVHPVRTEGPAAKRRPEPAAVVIRLAACPQPTERRSAFPPSSGRSAAVLARRAVVAA